MKDVILFGEMGKQMQCERDRLLGMTLRVWPSDVTGHIYLAADLLDRVSGELIQARNSLYEKRGAVPPERNE
jgi:hypothetical protein